MASRNSAEKMAAPGTISLDLSSRGPLPMEGRRQDECPGARTQDRFIASLAQLSQFEFKELSLCPGRCARSAVISRCYNFRNLLHFLRRARINYYSSERQIGCPTLQFQKQPLLILGHCMFDQLNGLGQNGEGSDYRL